MVKNAEDAGLVPGLETKIPQAAGQLSWLGQLLSPCTTAREEPVHCNEEPMDHNEDSMQPN